MAMNDCTITVERLGDRRYRATASQFSDCVAVADTEEAARRAVEAGLERLLRARAEREDQQPHEPR
jgi:predicted RNase H-like HicB family nuclease